MQSLKFITILIVISYSLPSQACELTKEYKEARIQARRDAQQPYHSCINSISQARYWYSYVQCKEAGHGKNIGDGCSHVAGNINKYKQLKIDDKFCNKLKVTAQEINDYFQYIIKTNNIDKCK